MIGHFLLQAIPLLHRSPLVTDGGPDYHEFHAHSFIKEPWNAASSLFFLVPVFYWIWKLRGRYRENLIITAILPLLFLNGIGSTLYHAFRNERVFIFLDGAPAAIMMLVLGVYFWSRIMGTWKLGVLIIPLVIGLQFAASAIMYAYGIDRNAGVNVYYTISGLSLLGIPLAIILYRSKFYRWKHVLWTTVFLIGAVTFRSLDYPTPNYFDSFMPQGTHFLWHLVSALAVFSLGWYLYDLKDVEIGPKRHKV